MEKEKVLLPPRNNREEIATSTQSSLQVQRASVARMTTTVNSSDFVSLSFFFCFLVFSQKLRGRVTRNIEKKAHGLKCFNHFFVRSCQQKWIMNLMFSCLLEGCAIQ